MEMVLYSIILIVSIGFLSIAFFVIPRNYIKKNIVIIYSYTLITLAIFFLLINLDCFKNVFYRSNLLFIDIHIVYMFSFSLSLLIMTPLVFIVRNIHQKIIIKRIEKNISFKKFAHYRDLVGNIPPALLMTIYNRKVKIEEQLISSYIYMKEHNIIKIKSDQIVGDYDKELESHENYLISYFLGMIDQNTYIDNYKYYIYKDLKTNKDIKKLIDNSYNNTHFLEIFIGWIMITQLILISTLSAVGNIGTYVIIAFACPFIVIPLYIIFKAKYPFVKTKKGLELEAKLNKIKQYLNNADNIKDKKNAKFYEEYILYSILFNDTDELNKECRKEYNNITKYINNSTNQLLYNKLHISISKEKIIGLIITFVVVTYMSWIFSTISLSIAIISWIIFTLILVTCILLTDYHNK